MLSGAQGSLLVVFLLCAQPLPGQSADIAIIDFYGIRRVSRAEVRIALGYRPGDRAPTAAEEDDLLDSLRDVSGVRDASLHLIQVGGRLVLYVGIEEEGSEVLTYSPAPHGDLELPDDVVADYLAFQEALRVAVRAGRAGEDLSQGHSLLLDPQARALQLKFVEHAAQHFDLLEEVLAQAGDSGQREIAAMVLAYAEDKRSVLPALLAAVRDPSPGVRNNAVRALGVLASYAQDRPELAREISPEPFVEMLSSLAWTDRNKALMVLFFVTSSRDPATLAAVSAAWDALLEMARWQHEGHALVAFMVVARIAGVAEAEIFSRWQSQDRSAWLTELDAAHRAR